MHYSIHYNIHYSKVYLHPCNVYPHMYAYNLPLHMPYTYVYNKCTCDTYPYTRVFIQGHGGRRGTVLVYTRSDDLQCQGHHNLLVICVYVYVSIHI